MISYRYAHYLKAKSRVWYWGNQSKEKEWNHRLYFTLSRRRLKVDIWKEFVWVQMVMTTKWDWMWLPQPAFHRLSLFPTSHIKSRPYWSTPDLLANMRMSDSCFVFQECVWQLFKVTLNFSGTNPPPKKNREGIDIWAVIIFLSSSFLHIYSIEVWLIRNVSTSFASQFVMVIKNLNKH